MKNEGITLISLVITIIILLIVAGIVISLTLNQGGLIDKTKDAVKNYADSQDKELAGLDTLTNTFDQILQNVVDNNETNSGETSYDSSLLKLKAGDYVKYDSGTNGIIACRVLYSADSQYGLQIIANNVLTYVPIEAMEWEDAKVEYNNAIKILNDEAMKYLNTDYAKDARCVGTNPSNKNMETNETITLPDEYSLPNGWQTKETGCKKSDTNYEIDMHALQAANMYDIKAYYCLASRFVNIDSNYCQFYLYHVEDDPPNGATLGKVSICGITRGGGTFGNSNGYSILHGIRACISLKNDIKIIGGDGMTEETSYVLGK